ncbi:hypothetical protein [Crocinitomix catalasitica]|uniref:hypothetical protein n=1 Tax=Crocinitomix catalasitica TaxID=184607 RepID=UPI0004883841|nr:hypothetical protein [Crocinitomix catalasitica]
MVLKYIGTIILIQFSSSILYGQEKKYEVVRSIINVEKVFDLNTIYNDTSAICLKQVVISISNEAKNVCIKDFVTTSLREKSNSTDLALTNQAKMFLMTDGNILFETKYSETNYHADIKILYFKYYNHVFIGFTIDNHSVFDSLIELIIDTTYGNNKNEIILFLTSLVISNDRFD